MFRGTLTKVIAFVVLCHLSRAEDPQPVSVPADKTWAGYDGTWSPIRMGVGSPQQGVSLFPHTLGREIQLIGVGGCDGTTECASKRGWAFQSNDSSTWDPIGSYLLDPESALGVFGTADYGFDAVSIPNAVSVPGQVVGVFNTTEFLLGSLGLGIVEPTFATEKQPTFLSSLVKNKTAIPSRSYGYTAGAYYRLKGVPASLTLGGIDLNRLNPSDVSFDMPADLQPVVSINAISVSSSPPTTSTTKPNWAEEPLFLLDDSEAELFTVDSSTPFLWLPPKVCDAFALALNLTYNETLQLYLYENGTDPSTLENWNMTFTFTIADYPGSSKGVNINLPYDAFNHQLTFPFPALNATVSSPAVDYFPLRKASNNTQYTIGRVFLQEAYLAVNYERMNFSISQAKFVNDAFVNTRLVSMTGVTQRSSGGLSVGAKAGLGVGIAALAMIATGLAVFFCLRRRRPSSSQSPPPRNSNDDSTPTLELMGDKRPPIEVPADKSNTCVELPGSPPVELEAHIPASYYALEKARSGTLAELEHRDSTSKNSTRSYTDQSSRSPSLPPYSAAQVGQRSECNVSPSRTLFNAGGAGSGTSSSGISGISPNDPSSNNSPTYGRYGLVRGPSSAYTVSTAVPSPLHPPTPSSKPGNQPSPNTPSSREGDQAAPSRNISRSSRFQEEGIGARPQQRPKPGRNFSWEDER